MKQNFKKGQVIQKGGYITRWKNIKLVSKNKEQMAKILGMKAHLLKDGYVIAHLTKIPEARQLELKGYNQVADHRVKISEDWENSLKPKTIADMRTWGAKDLVKVIPMKYTSPDNENYPPGSGIPQFKLNAKVPMVVFEVVK